MMPSRGCGLQQLLGKQGLAESSWHRYTGSWENERVGYDRVQYRVPGLYWTWHSQHITLGQQEL